jgi:hypothetical protein
MTKQRNPYIRIMQAAEQGRGVVLSANEVYYMAQDSAIETVAANLMGGIETGMGHFRLTPEGFEDIDDSIQPRAEPG